MKKTWNCPKLNNFGALPDVTQAFGSGAGDTFTGPISGSVPGAASSQPGIIVPVP